MADATPGTLIGGDFRLLRPLGAGGMGMVWVAEQLSTGIPRAIKLLRPELVGDEAQLSRFLNEARIGARIPSDHVVQVLGAGQDPTLAIPWLAMELLEGISLGGYLRENARMHPADTCEVLAQLCHALGTGHARGIVHRDVKPENVFLAVPRREGARFTVKVLDFGIAKLLSGGQTTTAPLGSPVWMSPEQTEAHTNVTPATDVWALGLMTFRMLTGKHFWMTPQTSNGSVTSLMREIVLEPIPPASARAAALGCAEWLPPGFDAWFAQCVCRDVNARFQDATSAKAALDTVLPVWEPARARPPGPFAFGDVPHHSIAFAAVGASEQPTAAIGPAGSVPAGASGALDQFGTSVPVSFGQSAPSPIRFSATDWRGSPPAASRVPLILGALGTGAVLVAGVLGLVAWKLFAQPSGSPAIPGVPATPGGSAVDYAVNYTSVPAGKKAPGVHITPYSLLDMSGSVGLTFVEAGDRCHVADLGTGNALCSPAQWRYACEQKKNIGESEAWVGSLVSDDEALVCGGDGGCDRCKKVRVDDRSAHRRGPCCNSAPLLKSTNPEREPGGLEGIALTSLNGNRYSSNYSMAFPYFAATVDWYDSKGLSGDAVQKLLRDHQSKNKDDWSVDEECTTTEGPPTGIALTHDCRRTVRTAKEITAVMTRLEYQRQSQASTYVVLRAVRDTKVLFRTKL